MGTVLIALLLSAERRSRPRPYLSGHAGANRSYACCPAAGGAQAPPRGDDHDGDMPGSASAAPPAPAREVLVARQPVLDADMGLLGFELLVDGAAAVVDALSEIGLDTLTAGHAAWLPLDRELLLEAGPPPVRSDRVVLEVDARDLPDPELEAAVVQLAARGSC